jgi:hypothetical protein
VEEHDYLVCPDGAEDRLKRRALRLSILYKAGALETRREEAVWKEIAGMLLTQLHAFRQAAATISQRYFDREEVLFPDLVRSLAELIKYTEDLVATFNDEIAGKPEDTMDVEAFRQGAGKVALQQISYLMDMARAEALDAVGEDRAATVGGAAPRSLAGRSRDDATHQSNECIRENQRTGLLNHPTV